jgi:hypothetical protein
MSSETSSEAAQDEDDVLLPSQGSNATEIDIIVTKSSSKPRSFVWKHMKIGNKAVCTPLKKLTIQLRILLHILKRMELIRRVPIQTASFDLELDS